MPWFAFTEILQKRSKSFWSFGTKLPVLLVGFVFIVLFGSFGFCDIALAIHIKTNVSFNQLIN